MKTKLPRPGRRLARRLALKRSLSAARDEPSAGGLRRRPAPIVGPKNN